MCKIPYKTSVTYFHNDTFYLNDMTKHNTNDTYKTILLTMTMQRLGVKVAQYGLVVYIMPTLT